MKRSILQTLFGLLIAAVVATACNANPTQTLPIGETPSGGTIRAEANVETILS